jgi:hypothetical protein
VAPEPDECITYAQLADAVDIDELRVMLGRASRRGERVSRSYATTVADSRSFPAPFLDHPRLRLWRRGDIETWMDANRSGWRES